MDRAPGVAAQVITLGGGLRDRGGQPPGGQDRAERVQPRAAVAPGRGQERDREPRCARRPGLSAAMSGHSITAMAAMSGASDSNSRQVTMTFNAARVPGLAPAFTPRHTCAPRDPMRDTPKVQRRVVEVAIGAGSETG